MNALFAEIIKGIPDNGFVKSSTEEKYLDAAEELLERGWSEIDTHRFLEELWIASSEEFGL